MANSRDRAEGCDHRFLPVVNWRANHLHAYQAVPWVTGFRAIELFVITVTSARPPPKGRRTHKLLGTCPIDCSLSPRADCSLSPRGGGRRLAGAGQFCFLTNPIVDLRASASALSAPVFWARWPAAATTKVVETAGVVHATIVVPARLGLKATAAAVERAIEGIIDFLHHGKVGVEITLTHAWPRRATSPNEAG
jgi:hypothetical protein